VKGTNGKIVVALQKRTGIPPHPEREDAGDFGKRGCINKSGKEGESKAVG